MDTLNNLLNLGLNKKEAATYLAALELGPASISQLAARAQIKRPSLYHYLTSLINKGLVYQTAAGKRKQYATHEPNQLLSIMEQNRQGLALILPELTALYRASPKQPRVMLYEGKNNLIKVYNEIFSTTYNLYAVFSPAKFFKLFSHRENAAFFAKLKTNGGKLFNLAEQSDNFKEILKQGYRKGISQDKFLPASVKVAVDFLIAKKRVALVSLNNQTATIIEDEDVASAMTEMFKLVWSSIK